MLIKMHHFWYKTRASKIFLEKSNIPNNLGISLYPANSNCSSFSVVMISAIFLKWMQIQISQRLWLKIPTWPWTITGFTRVFYDDVLIELDNKLAFTNRELFLIRDFLAETTKVESDNRGLRLELQSLFQIDWI